MFFIGIFGTGNKVNNILTRQNVICPICGAYGRYEVLKAYSYFHVFFIPLWKWNRNYLIQTRCCGNLCVLDDEVGAKAEAGADISISRKHIHCSEGSHDHRCPHCNAKVDAAFQYCPHCGKKI